MRISWFCIGVASAFGLIGIMMGDHGMWIPCVVSAIIFIIIDVMFGHDEVTQSQTDKSPTGRWTTRKVDEINQLFADYGLESRMEHFVSSFDDFRIIGPTSEATYISELFEDINEIVNRD